MPFENETPVLPTTDIAIKKTIAEFAAEAMRIADRQTILELGEVVNASLIQEKTGLNVAGFTRVLDNYGVRHTLKQHGNAKQEGQRGQIAVTLEDFEKILVITSEPDNIFATAQKQDWP